MVRITTDHDNLIFEVQGWDKFWVLKSRLEVPRSNVRGVHADPTIAREWWKGSRLPGTHVPGVIIAGTFYPRDKRVFWDVKDPDRTIVIDLAGRRYDQLIFEMADPAAELQRIGDAI